MGWYWGGGAGWGWGFAAGVATVGISVGSPWGWGYYSYWNPYWVAPPGGVTYINYSQPIVIMEQVVATAPVVVGGAPAPSLAQGPTPAAVPASASTAGENSNREKSLEIFENARGLFKRDDYPLALAEINRALALVPNDSLMHEFRALCLFAQHDYQQSAAALYAVLSAGPGWDSATVVGLYSTPGAYTDHLLALEAYRSENPRAADARFVLAYHFLLAGQNEQAETELAAVVELEPKDQLSAQLLAGLRAKPPAELPGDAPAPELPGAVAPAEAKPPVDAADLVGNWKASRVDGSKFELTLSEDSKFRWNFSQQEKKQEFSGTFTLANNLLILSASGQNALVGQVALEEGDKLQFKLAGGSPTDPGLTFTR